MNHQEEISRLAEEMEAMKERHSVRQYEDRPLDQNAVASLQEEISACNREGGLHIQLVTNEPKAFDGFMAHYGKFSGVHCHDRKKGTGSGRKMRLLRRAPRTEGPAAWAEHLLGRHDIQQDKDCLHCCGRREALYRHLARIRQDERRTAQIKIS